MIHKPPSPTVSDQPDIEGSGKVIVQFMRDDLERSGTPPDTKPDRTVSFDTPSSTATDLSDNPAA